MIRLKEAWIFFKWICRGKPTKTIVGGWCGCCGTWLPNAKFEFRDYHKVDNFWDLNTICPNKCTFKKKRQYAFLTDEQINKMSNGDIVVSEDLRCLRAMDKAAL